MLRNSLSDELSIHLLTHDFNSRSFLMFLRRQNETHREICTAQHDRQYPSKYCSLNHSRGFARMNKCHCVPACMISQDGVITTDDLSKQLLDANLCTVRRYWQNSKVTFSDKIKHIQSDLNSHTDVSLKKAMCGCQIALFNWISKNRLR